MTNLSKMKVSVVQKIVVVDRHKTNHIIVLSQLFVHVYSQIWFFHSQIQPEVHDFSCFDYSRIMISYHDFILVADLSS